MIPLDHLNFANTDWSALCEEFSVIGQEIELTDYCIA
jgi:hypothetical protein